MTACDHTKKITIAVVGLSFGAYFAEIYASHPNVERVVLIDFNKDYIKRLMDRVQSDKMVVCDSFEAAMADSTIDAVHVCTGIPSHAKLTIAALNAGKHCACAVPMATSLEDIQAIVDAARRSGKNYMMMETQLYGGSFFKAKDMLEKGEFGKIQHMRGIHYQPMEHGYWNTSVTNYWQGLPPMHYATHAIAPLYGLAGSRIEKVVCFGSGTMGDHLVERYGNPYPVEDALLSFENGMKGQVVRGLFECSAKSTESFNVYGSKKTMLNEYASTIITMTYSETSSDKTQFITETFKHPNRYDLLPEELHRFTISVPDEQAANYRDYLDTAPLRGHGGSHPHLCHEFVSSVIEGRKTSINEDVAANITAAGICAHTSAMNGGSMEIVPKF